MTELWVAIGLMRLFAIRWDFRLSCSRFRQKSLRPTKFPVPVWLIRQITIRRNACGGLPSQLIKQELTMRAGRA